jgi:hypothetical protein
MIQRPFGEKLRWAFKQAKYDVFTYVQTPCCAIQFGGFAFLVQSFEFGLQPAPFAQQSALTFSPFFRKATAQRYRTSRIPSHSQHKAANTPVHPCQVELGHSLRYSRISLDYVSQCSLGLGSSEVQRTHSTHLVA